ncbi:hypothetical protein [Caulobacter segnis]|uniref:hypothetical protein n=1 Tax=Caulobacter segnis TaxID=88688 RepID=UPI001CBF5D94|nr:hypothetical protein [Caulobacter segnis]UAL10182.1 hypothetical protein K8940_20830 [Caulobacter segnis]
MSEASAPSSEAIREQVGRLKRSAAFAGSDKLFTFLHFVVEETLQGNGAGLKEWVIGNAVYGRDPPYDPRIDSTVRVEARRLRRKLQEHYAGPGREDPLLIGLPLGGYGPSFEPNPAARPEGPTRRVRNAGETTLAVMPFRAHSAREADGHFADGLTDELILLAAGSSNLRVAPRLAVFQYRDRVIAPQALATALQVEVLVHGSVRWEDASVRLTLELCDVTGFVVWSERIDGAGDDRLALQEELAARAWMRLEAALAARARSFTPPTEVAILRRLAS